MESLFDAGSPLVPGDQKLAFTGWQCACGAKFATRTPFSGVLNRQAIINAGRQALVTCRQDCPQCGGPMSAVRPVSSPEIGAGGCS
jgi:hypothetical protein